MFFDFHTFYAKQTKSIYFLTLKKTLYNVRNGNDRDNWIEIRTATGSNYFITSLNKISPPKRKCDSLCVGTVLGFTNYQTN